ncbi:HYC_CC_PP family protein [Tenacibaculum sp.]
MKKFLFKILSFCMALLVLLSTISFTIDMHYCGDTLVDVAIFHKAKSCGMDMEHTNTDYSVINKNCCSEKQITVKGQDELNTSFDNLTLHQQQFVALFVYTYVNLFEDNNENVTSFRSYRPPLVIKQIYKLDETYLI